MGEPEVGEPLVTLRDAAFGYGKRPVVAGVSLEVRAGDFLAILGDNGSGKTTLVRGILGLLAPLAGTVTAHTHLLGYVPQRETLDAVFPLTVEEVVQTGAYGRLRGWRALSKAERRGARDALARLRLANRAEVLFSSLSGGQRQRALLARALLMRPRLLLLDEPTSGVDRPTQELVLELLRELNRDEDLAILIVSHQPEMVAGHDVVRIADGSARRVAVSGASASRAARVGVQEEG